MHHANLESFRYLSTTRSWALLNAKLSVSIQMETLWDDDGMLLEEEEQVDPSLPVEDMFSVINKSLDLRSHQNLQP